MGLLRKKPAAARSGPQQARSTASQVTGLHGAELLYCRQCATWIAVSAIRELSTHPTSEGIVTYFRCAAGHADLDWTSTAPPSSEYGNATKIINAINLAEEGEMKMTKTDRTSIPELDPGHIMQVGMGFWPSKTLLSAVELGLFTALGHESLTGDELAASLELRSRAVYDFLDGLVALGFLERQGLGEGARYHNTPETAAFLDANSPQYVGGILEMVNARLYRFWDGLTEALQTGRPQNEVKHTGRSMFDELYRDPARLEQFMRAMSGISAGNFHALAEKFDFSPYHSLCDVGGATGQLSVILAERRPHLRCVTFDLPVVEPIARRTIERAGMGERVTTASGDFLSEPLPSADVITMGLILHDWNLERKLHLIRAAYEALPPGGAFIVVENLIDDDRRENVFGLMMSLNMLIEFGDAFDFTGADFRRWCIDVGFRSVDIIPLAGPTSAGVAYK